MYAKRRNIVCLNQIKETKYVYSLIKKEREVRFIRFIKIIIINKRKRKLVKNLRL